jgi:hypothetical protein
MNRFSARFTNYITDEQDSQGFSLCKEGQSGDI